jgi:hypothetical protein
VKWADLTARTLAETTDALVKWVAGLGVPEEMAWESLPGWTKATVERARQLRESNPNCCPPASYRRAANRTQPVRDLSEVPKQYRSNRGGVRKTKHEPRCSGASYGRLFQRLRCARNRSGSVRKWRCFYCGHCVTLGNALYARHRGTYIAKQLVNVDPFRSTGPTR